MRAEYCLFRSGDKKLKICWWPLAAQAQLGLPYPNATPTFTLAYSDRALAARTLPPQYAAAAARGVPPPNLTDAEVYRPIKAAFAPLLAAAPQQARAARALCAQIGIG